MSTSGATSLLNIRFKKEDFNENSCKKGKCSYASPHQHPHEQCGYVISGKYELTIGDERYELISGDSYAIPGNQDHSFRAIEPGEVVDVFTPPREDYL